MGKKIECIGRYQMDGVVLGKGNFARVELATHQVTNIKVAIKVIDTRKIKEDYVRNNLHREARIMAALRHPNIIRLYETLKATTLCCLVTEYASGGELLNYIKSQKESRLGESQSRAFIRQLLSALYYLHEKGVVHRDIKMENIMLDEKKKSIKLIDFGLSNIFSKEQQLKTHCGSPEYAAPELFQVGRTYGPEIDVWSLGIISYAMILGRLPFTTPFKDEYQRQRLLQAIQRGLTGFHDEEMHCLSPDCRHLLRRLIEPDPELRAPLSEVTTHPWVTKNGKMPFSSYQAPPKDKAMAMQCVTELSMLVNLKRKEIGETVKENKGDELSAMFNMLMDQKRVAQGIFDVDHTYRKGARRTDKEPRFKSASCDREKVKDKSTTANGDKTDEKRMPKKSLIKSSKGANAKCSTAVPSVKGSALQSGVSRPSSLCKEPPSSVAGTPQKSVQIKAVMEDPKADAPVAASTTPAPPCTLTIRTELASPLDEQTTGTNSPPPLPGSAVARRHDVSSEQRNHHTHLSATAAAAPQVDAASNMLLTPATAALRPPPPPAAADLGGSAPSAAAAATAAGPTRIPLSQRRNPPAKLNLTLDLSLTQTMPSTRLKSYCAAAAADCLHSGASGGGGGGGSGGGGQRRPNSAPSSGLCSGVRPRMVSSSKIPVRDSSDRKHSDSSFTSGNTSGSLGGASRASRPSTLPYRPSSTTAPGAAGPAAAGGAYSKQAVLAALRSTRAGYVSNTGTGVLVAPKATPEDLTTTSSDGATPPYAVSAFAAAFDSGCLPGANSSKLPSEPATTSAAQPISDAYTTPSGSLSTTAVSSSVATVTMQPDPLNSAPVSDNDNDCKRRRARHKRTLLPALLASVVHRPSTQPTVKQPTGRQPTKTAAKPSPTVPTSNIPTSSTLVSTSSSVQSTTVMLATGAQFVSSPPPYSLVQSLNYVTTQNTTALSTVGEASRLTPSTPKLSTAKCKGVSFSTQSSPPIKVKTPPHGTPFCNHGNDATQRTFALNSSQNTDSVPEHQLFDCSSAPTRSPDASLVLPNTHSKCYYSIRQSEQQHSAPAASELLTKRHQALTLDQLTSTDYTPPLPTKPSTSSLSHLYDKDSKCIALTRVPDNSSSLPSDTEVVHQGSNSLSLSPHAVTPASHTSTSYNQQQQLQQRKHHQSDINPSSIYPSPPISPCTSPTLTHRTLKSPLPTVKQTHSPTQTPALPSNIDTTDLHPTRRQSTHHDSHHDSSHHDSSHHDSSHHDNSHHDSSHHDSSHHDSGHLESLHHNSSHHDSHHDKSHHDNSNHYNTLHDVGHYDSSNHDSTHQDDSYHDNNHHDSSHHDHPSSHCDSSNNGGAHALDCFVSPDEVVDPDSPSLSALWRPVLLRANSRSSPTDSCPGSPLILTGQGRRCPRMRTPGCQSPAAATSRCKRVALPLAVASGFTEYCETLSDLSASSVTAHSTHARQHSDDEDDEALANQQLSSQCPLIPAAATDMTFDRTAVVTSQQSVPRCQRLDSALGLSKLLTRTDACAGVRTAGSSERLADSSGALLAEADNVRAQVPDHDLRLEPEFFTSDTQPVLRPSQETVPTENTAPPDWPSSTGGSKVYPEVTEKRGEERCGVNTTLQSRIPQPSLTISRFGFVSPVDSHHSSNKEEPSSTALLIEDRLGLKQYDQHSGGGVKQASWRRGLSHLLRRHRSGSTSPRTGSASSLNSNTKTTPTNNNVQQQPQQQQQTCGNGTSVPATAAPEAETGVQAELRHTNSAKRNHGNSYKRMAAKWTAPPTNTERDQSSRLEIRASPVPSPDPSPLHKLYNIKLSQCAGEESSSSPKLRSQQPRTKQQQRNQQQQQQAQRGKQRKVTGGWASCKECTRNEQSDDEITEMTYHMEQNVSGAITAASLITNDVKNPSSCKLISRT